MAAPEHDRSVTLDLSLEEAWVAYVALASRAERTVRDGGDPAREREMLERIEADRYRFAPRELAALDDALDDYLVIAPARDRAPGRAVLEAVRAVAP